MDVKRPEVSAKLLLLLDANVLEVLASEHDDAALGEQECELVLLRVVELRELDAADFGPDDRRQTPCRDLGTTFREQVGLLLIRSEPFVLERGEFEGLEEGLLIVYRKVVGVFVLRMLGHGWPGILTAYLAYLVMGLVVVCELQAQRSLGLLRSGLCGRHTAISSGGFVRLKLDSVRLADLL